MAAKHSVVTARRLYTELILVITCFIVDRHIVWRTITLIKLNNLYWWVYLDSFRNVLSQSWLHEHLKAEPSRTTVFFSPLVTPPIWHVRLIVCLICGYIIVLKSLFSIVIDWLCRMGWCLLRAIHILLKLYMHRSREGHNLPFISKEYDANASEI